MSDSTKKTIAIAGSTGFVGTKIREHLQSRHKVIALTRSPTKLGSQKDGSPVQWVHCNAHSQQYVKQSLEGVDTLIYLIHSMLPSSRLTQANFQDLDLMLADNFAKSAKLNGVKQIIYISGLIPKNVELSKHLNSRFEVEEVLSASGVPCSTLRCGLIIGPGGSSLKILLHLVKRLPVMLLPSWTTSLTQPISIRDVLRALDHCLDSPETFKGSFDIGCPQVMTYREMMKTTSQLMGHKTTYVNIRGITTWLSKRWVSVVSGCSMELVGPLVDSLKHDMVVNENPLQQKISSDALSFRDAIKESMDVTGRSVRNPREALRPKDDNLIRIERRVRSVQRFFLPKGKDAQWVMQEYLRWLPDFLNPLLVVDIGTDTGHIAFRVRGCPKALLELKFRDDGDEKLRVAMIVGGLLANVKDSPGGRLELRVILGGKYVMAAVHDFSPRLPWCLYNATQALAHLLVMKAFGRHLKRICDAP